MGGRGAAASADDVALVAPHVLLHRAGECVGLFVGVGVEDYGARRVGGEPFYLRGDAPHTLRAVVAYCEQFVGR